MQFASLHVNLSGNGNGVHSTVALRKHWKNFINSLSVMFHLPIVLVRNKSCAQDNFQVIINMIYVRCTRCNQRIDVRDPRTYLLRAGKLVRIRCQAERCLTTDWYNEAEFEDVHQPEKSPQTELSNSGLMESRTHWYDLLTSGV